MIKPIYLFLFLLLQSNARAQQQTFDIFTFTPPLKWIRSLKENSLLFSTTNNSNRTWAQIDLLKRTASKGTPDADFKSEWQDLVMKRYGVTSEPLTIDTQSFQGWKLYTGAGKFLFRGDTASVLLRTFSDGINCASFLLLSNTTAYGKVLDEFAASISLSASGTVQSKKAPEKKISITASSDGYQFNTSNFDDGWTGVVKEDWVELTKGAIKALLHYPRAEDSKYYTEYDEQVNTFWNLLVAPRYSNLRQYQSPGYNYSSESGFFAAGLLNDKATKKDVWVVLFSKGKSGWIEVIAPDKNSFVQAFGIDNPDRYFANWDALLQLAGKNRFAVGENDLIGKWSNEFVGSTYYYGLHTGLYAGASTYASRQNFVFSSNKTYSWDIATASGATGTRIKADQSKANGTWKLLSNWKVWFSDIEKNPKTYNMYFSCFKGGRILWLQDAGYGSYTAYGKISK